MRRTGYMLTMVLGAALACGSSDRILGNPGSTQEVTIGPDGGTLALADSAVTLVFPPGAVTETVSFTATPRSDVGPTVLTGTVYDVQPSMTFQVPVQVTVAYDESVLPIGVRESELGLYKLESTWQKVSGSVVNQVDNLVQASLTSFSTYGVLGAPVTAVSVSGASSVEVGETLNLSALATDADGASLPARAISWTSLAPQIASVSQSGMVTGVAVGSADIRAASEGVSGQRTVLVTPKDTTSQGGTQVLAAHNFDDSSLGPFNNPWGSGIDVPVDPTSSGRGRVARISYAPPSGQSQERALVYRANSRLRYGETIWFRGDLYMPSAGADATHNRKLLDYQGGGVRMTLHRRGPSRDLRLSIVDAMNNGFEEETIAESTGISLADDTWHTIEVRMTTNSADNVRDGVLEIYINGANTPDYRRSSGLGWVTETFSGGSYFQSFMAGFQLTIDSGDPAYQEFRYWDNIMYSTGRN